MDHMPLPVVIFQSIPEAIIIVYVACTLINEKGSFGQLLLIGFLTAASSYYIRSLPAIPESSIYISM